MLKLYKQTSMTQQEMDHYLESIGGLIEVRWQEPHIITSSMFMDIGEGWYPLVQNLINDLIVMDWDKQICQIKEKFGGLRFYINGGHEDLHKRIRNAEELSYTICEMTGQPGELRRDLGWWQTLCETEYLKRKSLRNQYE
jgi:hypothetical protein